MDPIIEMLRDESNAIEARSALSAATNSPLRRKKTKIKEKGEES